MSLPSKPLGDVALADSFMSELSELRALLLLDRDSEIGDLVARLGGTVVPQADQATHCIVETAENNEQLETAERREQLETCKELELAIVTPSWLDAAKAQRNANLRKAARHAVYADGPQTTRVLLHIHQTDDRDPLEFLGSFVPNWADATTQAPPASDYKQPTLLATGSCNATHQVQYLGCERCQMELAPPDLNVYLAFPGWKAPTVPVGPNRTLRLLRTDDQTPHIRFRGLHHFVGIVGLSLSSTITNPRFDPRLVWRAGRILPVEPLTRQTLGIWVDNCGPAYRRRIIQTLLGSGIPVKSYGECLPNQNSSWRSVRLDDGGNELGAAECSQHRIMLAVENENCPGYFGDMLVSAIQRCRAIPIIHPVAGLPNYADLGHFPAINASQPGWLNLTRRIMSDDAFYKSFVTSWRRAPRIGTAPGRPSTASERPPGATLAQTFHCQFFDSSIRTLPERYVAWEPCAYCKGHLEAADGGEWCQEIDRPVGDEATDANGCLTQRHPRIIDTASCPAE